MPPLLLDDDEAVAIAVGLRTAASASVTGIEETSVRALVKLEQVLPSHLRRRVNALQSVTATLPPTGPDRRSRGADRDRGDVPRPRAPALPLPRARRRRDAGAAWSRTAWCTSAAAGTSSAWDPDRADWRTFRVDRLAGPAPAGRRFTPRELPAADPAAYVAQNLTGAAYRFQARVTVHAPADLVRSRSHHLWGTVEPIDDAHVRVPHVRRLARLARDADRDARLRVRGARAARARRALP